MMKALKCLCLVIAMLWIECPVRGQDVGNDVLEWERLFDQGRTSMESGRPAEALDAFLQADRMNLHEAPNYQALVGVAEAWCQLGQAELGLALLQDFRCSLAVERGDLQCYIGPETSEGPGHPNPKLTPTCYERMCGEIYLSYYEDPSEHVLARLERLSREAGRVESVCGDPP
jgi:hypothetical protein